MDFEEHLRANYFKEGHPLYLASTKKILITMKGKFQRKQLLALFLNMTLIQFTRNLKKAREMFHTQTLRDINFNAT